MLNITSAIGTIFFKFFLWTNFYEHCDYSARKNGCKCRLHKPHDNDDPAHFFLRHEHSHAGDARKIGKQRVHTKIKELAKTTDLNATAIIAESVQGQQKSTLAALPSNKSMVKTVYRQRAPTFARNPETLAELELSDEFRNTKDGNNFLLYDSGVEEDEQDRTLIFATDENNTFLSKCEEWFMDGTFSITPLLFKQVYIIHGKKLLKKCENVFYKWNFFEFKGRINGFNIPLVYVVTTNKRQETYELVLNVLLGINPNLNPTDITLDFEAAAINAVKKCFPLSEVHGCFFHFSSNIWKHVQQYGLQTIYNSNGDFALQIRMLTALAFVPTDQVEAAYNQLMETAFFCEEGMAEYEEHQNGIDNLVKYFQDTYVFATDRFGKRKPPLFPPAIWNVYENVLLGNFSSYFLISNFHEHFITMMIFHSLYCCVFK